jgi:HSP20 family protein
VAEPRLKEEIMLGWMDFDRTFAELDGFRREMDRLFERSRGTRVGETTGRWEARDDAFVLTVDLPGVKPEDVDLQVTRDAVTLKAERKLAAPEGYGAHRTERNGWKLSRTWTLPVPVDPERAVADTSEGVLTLTLPKAADAQPRKIALKS